MRSRLIARSGVGRPADQGGFALLTVLVVVAVTILLIGALFGLMLTTMRVTAAQERTAREARAADAAVETAINDLRDGECDPTAQPLLDGLVFDQQTGGTGDDVTVDVTCSSVAGGDSVTDQVRFVGGQGYRGALSTAWTQDCAVNATAGCMPWSAAVGSVPTGLESSRVSLVHSGPEPLRFSSGVTVRTGAAALRNPTDGNPAIEVGGQYNQGSRGLLGSSPTDCGVLSGSPGAGTGRISDLDDAPACGVPEAAGVDAQPTGNTAGLVASATVPTVPTTCGAGPVVAFVPGTYDAAATEAVSDLTDGSLAACRNKTFHFTPGVYSFLGTQLRFGDAGSYYVFGAASGWAAGGVQGAAGLVADPESTLCAPGSSGTSLVLAGWTRLTHTAGRVAICPAWPAGVTRAADAHPALYQQTIVPTGVQVTNINRTPVANGITLPFRCRIGFFYPTTTDYPSASGPCRPLRTYELRLATDGQAPVNSLRVMLTGTENVLTPNNLITNRQTRFRLAPASGGPICQTDFVAGMPNGGLTSSFDLKRMPGSCSTTAINQSQLNGARLFVDHRMDLGLITINQTFDVSRAEVEVNAVSGLPGSATSGDWVDVDNVTAVDNAAARPLMPCADFICQVLDPGRTRTPATPFVHEMTLDDFDFPGLLNSSNPGVDPSLTTLRAVVRVRPSALTLPSSWTATFGNFISTQNFLTPGTVRLELRSPSGGRCIVQGQGINSDQEIAFDLLDVNLEDPSASNCNSFVFANASDLDQVTLSLRFELPCVPNWFHNVPWECQRSSLFYNPADTSPIWQFRPPDIESVKLTTVTDTYSRSETSTVTVDATGGATSSSFNVFGRSWLPLADLDLNWNGAATAQPLFANDLVLHGMGSRMDADAQMGIVCCDPPDQRTVELVAVIDGVERLTARVEYSDVRDVGGGVFVYEPGFAVNVLRWLTCDQAGCAQVLAASDQRRSSGPGP
jgi:type II secretory pathway pseudopilin PulG